MASETNAAKRSRDESFASVNGASFFLERFSAMAHFARLCGHDCDAKSSANNDNDDDGIYTRERISGAGAG